MMRVVVCFFLMLVSSQDSIAQIPGFWAGKEYSKEVSLYRAKSFLVTEILKQPKSVIRFTIDPLAAASSGELTSLSYECEEQMMQGMILAFYGSYWNEHGVIYQGYGFKNLPKDKALDLMNTISKVLEENESFLKVNYDNNNVHLIYDDLSIIIPAGAFPRIRVFWKSFDAEWEITAFKRTKRRLERKLGDK
jgi:hypothetical protein